MVTPRSERGSFGREYSPEKRHEVAHSEMWHESEGADYVCCTPTSLVALVASPNGVDVSKELRRVLIERRDAAMLKAFDRGEDDLLPLVFPSETGGPGRRQPSVRKGADGPFEHPSNCVHIGTLGPGCGYFLGRSARSADSESSDANKSATFCNPGATCL
jgi:hypothetical protein